MTKAVLFDMDGLLIDSEKLSCNIFKDILREYDIEFTDEQYFSEHCGKTPETNMQILIDRYKLPVSVEDGVNKIGQLDEKNIVNGIPLKPGAEKLLEYLKSNNYKMALASSSPKQRAMRILESDNVKQYFDEFSFGCEVEHGKPFPDIFLNAAKKLDELPENCLVLEDSEAGIQAAHSAGIPVICIPDVKVPDKEFLDMTEKVYTSLTDIIDYLEKEM